MSMSYNTVINLKQAGFVKEIILSTLGSVSEIMDSGIDDLHAGRRSLQVLAEISRFIERWV